MVQLNIVNFLTIGLIAILAIAMAKWGLMLAGKDNWVSMI